MANKKISELTELLRANVNTDDVLAIVDDSATETKKIKAKGVAQLNEFDTISDLDSCPWLEVGDVVMTHGYNSLGDGGGNTYEIVAAATGTADGGAYIDLTTSSLQAKGLFPDGPNFNQWGATGDGITDDSTAIQAAIDWWLDTTGVTSGTGLPMKLSGYPGSDYRLNTGITLTATDNGSDHAILDFNGSSVTSYVSSGSNVFSFNAGSYLWRNFKVRDLDLRMNNSSADAGIFMDGSDNTPGSEALFRFVIDNPVIEGIQAGSSGIHIKNNAFEFYIENPMITAALYTTDTSTRCIYFQTDSQNPTSAHINGGTLSGGYDNVYWEGSGAPKLNDVTLLSASRYGVYVDTGSTEGTMVNCRVEQSQCNAVDNFGIFWKTKGVILHPVVGGGNNQFNVKGGSQSGTSLVCDGFFTSGFLDPEVDDKFTIDGVDGIYTITAVTDDGGGQFTVTLDTSLASSPADNATCTYTNKGTTTAIRGDANNNGITVIGGHSFSGCTKIFEAGITDGRHVLLNVPPGQTPFQTDTRLERSIGFVYTTHTVNAGNTSGSYTFDMNDGNAVVITATGNVTFENPDNGREGLELTLIVIQDGTGGRRLTFGGQFEGTRPPNQAANSVTVYRFKHYLNDWHMQSIESQHPVFDNGNTTGSYTHDMRDGGKVKLTATGAVTFNTSNEVGDDVLTLIFVQDGTGSRTLTFNAKFKTSGTSVSSTAGEATVFEFVWDGTNWWETTVNAGVT